MNGIDLRIERALDAAVQLCAAPFLSDGSQAPPFPANRRAAVSSSDDANAASPELAPAEWGP